MSGPQRPASAGRVRREIVRGLAESNTRAFDDLLDELRIVRAATIALLRGLPADAWMRRGIVNAYRATVRGLAFHIAGHELHHVRIIL